MGRNARDWAIIVVFTLIGVIGGLLIAAVTIFPVAQTLIDSDDDETVLWTILYFKWVALGCFGLAMSLGGLVGSLLGRTVAHGWDS